ncbi:ribosome biogenesis GTPase Der [Dactylosporangium sp. NPDC051541]|uniref:ribosome biogenesis GTPase Der n=1 Tax=Dactylosporangium sp. NPDC051541 TaxID=3363977 RepID=UPI00379A3621
MNEVSEDVFDESVDTDEDVEFALPIVAVVGRPNVGKSTLVNRVLGRRQAVVEDVAGVTRDRIAYDAEWTGRNFTIVDTGGWLPDARERAKAIATQAEIAAQTADVVLFVVDATIPPTADDEAAVRMLRRSGRKVILVANKVDNERLEHEISSLWGLGLGEPFPVSALHGRGSGDLLDKILENLPEARPVTPREAGPRRIALVGRPNVGKSSLLNKLAKEERAVVDSVAGTTVDPVDSLVEFGGETWHLVDTAGLRKRVSHASGTEYYASLRTNAAIEAAEVAIVLLDAGEVISEQDQRIITMVIESGRALVVAFNKWDLVDDDRRFQLAKEIDRELRRVPWAIRVNVSALTGRAVDKLAPALRTALTNWERRVPTGQLNQWLTALVQATPHPIRGGRAPRVLFATQAGVSPPKFVLFTTGVLDPGYVRFVERKLREEFDFTGTPIHITVKPRKKNKK